jgi:hypothetical protein
MRSGDILSRFLTSAISGGERPASRPDRFASREALSGAHFTGGWVSPEADLDTVEKIKHSYPFRNSNPDS